MVDTGLGLLNPSQTNHNEEASGSTYATPACSVNSFSTTRARRPNADCKVAEDHPVTCRCRRPAAPFVCFTRPKIARKARPLPLVWVRVRSSILEPLTPPDARGNFHPERRSHPADQDRAWSHPPAPMSPPASPFSPVSRTSRPASAPTSASASSTSSSRPPKAPCPANSAPTSPNASASPSPPGAIRMRDARRRGA